MSKRPTRDQAGYCAQCEFARASVDGRARMVNLQKEQTKQLAEIRALKDELARDRKEIGGELSALANEVKKLSDGVADLVETMWLEG